MNSVHAQPPWHVRHTQTCSRTQTQERVCTVPTALSHSCTWNTCGAYMHRVYVLTEPHGEHTWNVCSYTCTCTLHTNTHRMHSRGTATHTCMQPHHLHPPPHQHTRTHRAAHTCARLSHMDTHTRTAQYQCVGCVDSHAHAALSYVRARSCTSPFSSSSSPPCSLKNSVCCSCSSGLSGGQQREVRSTGRLPFLLCHAEMKGSVL